MLLGKSATAAIFALSITLSLALGACATAPKPTSTENPGYYRFKVGEFQVTALSDGTFSMPMPSFLTGISKPEIQKSLARHFLGDGYETSVNGFLIDTGSKRVLIDTGTGTAFGPTVGHLVEHLRAAGISPDRVDAILITHMHGDHVGGLSIDGHPVFKNATLYIDKADTDYWLNPETLNKVPADMEGHVQGAMAAVAPYQKSGQLKPFSTDIEITPGIHTHASHGHTPGHNSYVIESNGQKLVLLGDLLHIGAVQFEHHSARMKFDSDGNAAEKERRAAFADAAKGGYLIGSAHLPFPGVGHVRKEKAAYEFAPVNYTR